MFVVAIEACPIQACTVTGSTPRASQRQAAVCRRSWIRRPSATRRPGEGPLEGRGVQPVAGGGDEQLVVGLPPGAIAWTSGRTRSATGTRRSGRTWCTFDSTPFGCGPLHDQHGIGTSTKSRTRTARSSDQRSPVQPAISRMSASRWSRATAAVQRGPARARPRRTVHLGPRPRPLGTRVRGDRVERDHPLPDRPGEERRQRRPEPSHRRLGQAGPVSAISARVTSRSVTAPICSAAKAGRHEPRQRRVRRRRSCATPRPSLLQPLGQQHADRAAAGPRVDPAGHGRPLASEPGQRLAPGVEGPARRPAGDPTSRRRASDRPAVLRTLMRRSVRATPARPPRGSAGTRAQPVDPGSDSLGAPAAERRWVDAQRLGDLRRVQHLRQPADCRRAGSFRSHHLVPVSRVRCLVLASLVCSPLGVLAGACGGGGGEDAFGFVGPAGADVVPVADDEGGLGRRRRRGGRPRGRPGRGGGRRRGTAAIRAWARRRARRRAPRVIE